MYNRVHEMFSIFGTTESRINDFSEGFNNYWEHCVDTNGLTENHLKGIPRNQLQTALFRPLSGIFRQRQYIHLRYMPLTIELYLVYNNSDPLVAFDGDVFSTVNCSTAWSILNAQVQCDLITLDSGLNESYVKLLEEGKKLTLNYNTFISQYQTIASQTDFQSILQDH